MYPRPAAGLGFFHGSKVKTSGIYCWLYRLVNHGCTRISCRYDFLYRLVSFWIMAMGRVLLSSLWPPLSLTVFAQGGLEYIPKPLVWCCSRVLHCDWWSWKGSFSYVAVRNNYAFKLGITLKQCLTSKCGLRHGAI